MTATTPPDNVTPAGTAPVPVLLVDHTARMGGGEIALLRLVAAIDRRRYRPSVLLFADGPLRVALAAAGVGVTVLPLGDGVGDVRKDALGVRGLLSPRRAWAAVRFVSRLTAAIRASGAAVVHTNSLKSDVLAGLAARRAGVPLVWHVRDRIAGDYLPKAAVTAFRWAAATVPTFVIANSDATLRTVGPAATATPPRARVVHDGTPVDAAAPPPPPNGPALVVGLVGRLSPWKGQHVFLDAAALVRARFPTAVFQLIGSALFGEDAYADQLRDRSARADLAGAVQFLGFCDDVPARMAALDVLVHASTIPEPFGQVVIEGMAAGRPVVATAGGGVTEIVADGDSGLLVPMGDAAALAEAIERLLADPDLRARLAAGGRARVLAAFTVDRTARGVEAVYDQLLGRGER